jgi:DNA-binding transcriptional ArsR family regulator
MKKIAVSKKELDEYEAVFRALAHASRRHIILCLTQKGDPMLGGEIADQLSCSWPTTTGHLQTLEKAGLVTVNKRGREQIFEINKARFEIVERWLKIVWE